MSKSHWISDLHWVRSTQQQRGHKTQLRILAAAEALYSERGVQDTSIADIAKSAQCSVGAVYHHFRDKRALTHALLKMISDQMVEFSNLALKPERWQGAKIKDILDGLLALSIASHEEMPMRKRAKQAIMQEESEIQSHFSDLNTAIAERLKILFWDRRHEINHPDPDTAIEFVITQFQVMTEAHLMSDLLEPSSTSCSNEAFMIEMKRSFCLYLGLR